MIMKEVTRSTLKAYIFLAVRTEKGTRNASPIALKRSHGTGTKTLVVKSQDRVIRTRKAVVRLIAKAVVA